MTKKLYLILIIFITSCNNKNEKIKTTVEIEKQIELKLDEKQEKINEFKNSTEETITTASNSISVTALNFINDYAKNCDKINGRIGTEEWVESNPNASKMLKSELKKIMEEANKADPEYGLGFDPIFNAQDYPDEGFKLVDFDTLSGIVNVKDKILDGFDMKIKLVKENGKWVVNGIGIINMPESKWIQE
ncbi:hypothetical protein [Croceivirga radicis]|uniref:hypothetical protein n=1 Tax=Croceivirga radicis TaxID=1929488 RepID=UPI0012FF2970|nr:hypothetical protein [Croceivirga radicis]